MNHQFVTDKVKNALPTAIEEVVDFRDERTLIIDPAQFMAVCRLLRNDEDLYFTLLEDICADDYLPDFPRFAVNYHLYSLANHHRIRLKLFVEDPDEGPETLGGFWPVASWLEMEVYDLMGIKFKGNDGLRRLFLPEDWQGYPLRKDYPLGYEEVQFSFNWQAIDNRKPYAKD